MNSGAKQVAEFPNKATQFKPGQSGNPKGPKPGYKHISTWIQDMLNDENFETLLNDPRKGYIDYKGAPLKAIIETAVRRAIAGDTRWAEWLAKHGYGEKLRIELDDPRKELLKRYTGAENARQAEKAESRSSEDSA